MTTIEERRGVAQADYAIEAEREATEAGMDLHELRTALKGETITALFPPGTHESVVDYGVRATGEILVRYLMDDGSARP